MSKAGIQVLLNTVFPVERQGKRLLVLGSDDYWTGIPSTSAMPDKKEPGQVRIVLSHNPDYLSHLLEKTRFEFDLGLSGHTHGGQIKLPLIGALHYNIKDQRFAEGLFSHPRAVTYTSRGIGVVGLPIRINCPPEVNVFTLKRA